MIIRASALPLITLCPASIVKVPDEIRIENSGSHAADIGSAVHDLLSKSISLNMIPDDTAFMETALKFGVDQEEMTSLFWWSMRAWRRLCWYFPSPRTEVKVNFIDPDSGIEITGHIDLLSIVEE